jgi:hypothetical protein
VAQGVADQRGLAVGDVHVALMTADRVEPPSGGQGDRRRAGRHPRRLRPLPARRRAHRRGAGPCRIPMPDGRSFCRSWNSKGCWPTGRARSGMASWTGRVCPTSTSRRSPSTGAGRTAPSLLHPRRGRAGPGRLDRRGPPAHHQPRHQGRKSGAASFDDRTYVRLSRQPQHRPAPARSASSSRPPQKEALQ